MNSRSISRRDEWSSHSDEGKWEVCTIQTRERLPWSPELRVAPSVGLESTSSKSSIERQLSAFLTHSEMGFRSSPAAKCSVPCADE